MQRRATLGAVAALGAALAAAATAAALVPLPTRLTQALAVPNVSHRQEGAVAVDLDSGVPVFARNPDVSLVPASNEKLFVTYAAAKELGADYRFRTEVLGEGYRDGAVWHGDLVLKGFGDPTLTSAGLGRLAAQLAAVGIERVTGRLVGDESWFDAVRTAPGWKPDFYLAESAPLSALVVNGDVVGQRLALDPPLATAAQFRRLLRAHGITTGRVVVGRASTGATVLAEVHSRTLARILVDMDHDSENFVAEMLLKELGAEESGVGTTAAGSAVVVRALAGAAIPLAGVHIADGSGLSLDDRTTARALAALLVACWRDPALRTVVWNALATPGEPGTLEHRLPDEPAHSLVRAKTGTTDLSSALSGYVGTRYAFVLLENGSPVAWDWARLAQDRFVEALARAASG